jgi:hypothetical protein
MAELRPWKKEQISLGLFQVQKKLSVVDCSCDTDQTPICLEEPDPEKREQIVWTYINKAFSEPVSLYSQDLDYIPTQILVEALKQAGYDGIVYQSALGKGRNFAFFDLDAVKMLPQGSAIFTCDRIRYCFRRAG